ncbi:LPS export ABC transporter periplasmic protein LptC [Chitinophagales bacterium]|nr:LPS export ABC transporter periplasmic protein LptC [Chitinophagales bacterium]
MRYYLLLLFSTYCFCSSLQAQDDTTARLDSTANVDIVEILSTNKLQAVDSLHLKRLIGNVVLEQDGTIFRCDSADVYDDKNDIFAFGRVIIEQDDSITIMADYLEYDGLIKRARLYDNVYLTDDLTEIRSDSMYYFSVNKKAEIYGNVKIDDGKVNTEADRVDYYSRTKKSYLFGNAHLKDDDTEIYADEMDYNFIAESGHYRGNGRVLTKETTLTSENGFYNSATNSVLFTEKVFVQDPDYEMDTDSLLYDTNTGEAIFNGQTRIYNEGNVIDATSGTYDKENNQITLDSDPVMNNGSQTLIADNLFFDKETGIGYATGAVEWEDTAQQILMTGEYMEYMEDDDYVLVTDSVLMRQLVNGDTLYLAADTIASHRSDSINSFRAWYNVRIFKTDFQAACDSLEYSFADSIFRFFYDPVLWSDSSQLSGDSIVLYTEESNPSKIELLNNGLLGQEKYVALYDQLAGKNIIGFFENGAISTISITGNAESIYNGKNDDGSFFGLNQSKASRMNILMEDQEVQMIKMYENPDATFYPANKIDMRSYNLTGFKWREEERPLFPLDVFRIVESRLRRSVVVESTDSLAIDPSTDPIVDPSSKRENDMGKLIKETAPVETGPKRDPNKRGGRSGTIEEE